MLARLNKQYEFWRQVLGQHMGQSINWDIVANVSQAARKRDSSGVYSRGIWETLSLLLEKSLDDKFTTLLAWKIAGNEQLLMHGNAIVVFGQRSTHPAHEAVVQIGDIHFERKSTKGSIVYAVQLTARTGYLAGEQWVSYMPRPFLVALSRRIGFGAPWSKYPLHKIVDLSGLYFYAVLDTKADDQVRVQELKEAASLVTWNKKHVLGLRCRATEACPEGFQHQCHQCVAGRDRCRAATHAYTYKRGTCAACGDPEALMDPGVPGDKCVRCLPTIS